MTATYTFDVFSSLDGFGSHRGDWGGYWGRQGPELIARRAELYAAEQRIALGATTYREFVGWRELADEASDAADSWVSRMVALPVTVVSRTLADPLAWPDATVAAGDAVDIVGRMKEDSAVPIRSHGSLSLNRALLAAGLVDRIQVTLFPVVTGQTGTDPIFAGAADLDLELLEQQVFDGRTLELTYRPSLH